jgi:hypothetical protein
VPGLDRLERARRSPPNAPVLALSAPAQGAGCQVIRISRPGVI